jgi:hypothetical protein
MIISPETVKKRKRFQVQYPALMCNVTHLWFNKRALELLQSDEVYFEILKDKIFLRICILENETGFKISNYRINSRPIIRKLRMATGHKGMPKFKIQPTMLSNCFTLTLMK